MQTMELTILQERSFHQSRKVVLVDLKHSYGRKKAYMSGSICATAARLLALGHQVDIVDFNIDRPQDERVLNLLNCADLIGVSLVGSPYIPSMIEFAKEVTQKYPTAKLIVGGQVIRGFTQGQFRELFDGTNAIQISDDEDLAKVLNCSPEEIPDALDVSLAPVWKHMGDDRLRHYLENQEFTLVTSQGCKHTCKFCAAVKDKQEVFVKEGNFRTDLRYLASAARRFGLEKLECYTSSLDFFQNPEMIAKYLNILAEVRKEHRLDIRVRCLSCMDSFLHASSLNPGLGDLLNRAGLWCVGFGVDGADKKLWQIQQKGFNRLSDVVKCLALCQSYHIRAEILMVFGFPQDNFRTLAKNFIASMRFALGWKHTMLRPYLAKPFIPGNDGWQRDKVGVEKTLKDPQKFFNLDFCALGSRLTHPRFLHRWMCNLTYLGIIALLTPFNLCNTSPLLPQGSGNPLARFFNRLMPLDR